MAALLQKSLRDSGIRPRRKISVESAGMNANPNMPALPTISTIAYTRGIQMQDHRSRIVTPELIRNASLILTMEFQHKERILQRHPEMFDRVFQISEFGRDPDDAAIQDVIDPTGKDIEEFQQFVATADSEVNRIAKHLLRIGLFD